MNARHRWVFVSMVFLSALSFAQQAVSPASSATSAPQEPALSPRPTAAENPVEGKIKLEVVVVDKAGNPVDSLNVKDFTLFDNNQPAKIASFRAIPRVPAVGDPPLSVALVLDTVNEGFQRVSFARQEITRVLRANGGLLAQPVSIILLTNDGLSAHLDPSTDGNGLADQLAQLDSKLRTSNRAQGNWGDIERFTFSMQMFDNILNDQEARTGRKLLIWIGRGWPMLNTQAFELSAEAQQRYFDAIVQLSARFRESNVVLSSVAGGEPDPQSFLYRTFLKPVVAAKKTNPGNLALKVLATQSGGWILGPDNDLAGQINKCISGSAPYYILSFDPGHADRANEYHDLRVQIDQPGLSAKTSSGYYNQP